MNIIYEVSIVEDIATKSIKEHVKDILMDVRRGGIISDYEGKDWYRKAISCSPRSIKMILEKLSKEKKIVYNGVSIEEENESRWAEKAIESGRRSGRDISFVIVSSETSEGINCEKVKSPIELIGNTGWKDLQEGHIEVRNTLEVYKDKIKKLLGPSKKVRIIDPWLRMEGKSKKFIEYAIKYSSCYLKEGTDTEINVHTSTKYMDKVPKKIERSGRVLTKEVYPIYEELERLKSEVKCAYRQSKREKEVTFKIWVWSHEESERDKRFERLHDRYIVTDQFAVSIPWGLNIPEDERPPVTDWTLLRRERQESLTDQFPRDLDNYFNMRDDRGKFTDEDPLQSLRDLHPLHELEECEEFSLNPSSHETS